MYKACLERADRLELTIVEGDYEGDTYFPAWMHLIGTTFRLIERQDHDGFRFETYKRTNI